MVANARLGKEILIRTENKVGVLADISTMLADHGINIDAIVGYGEGAKAEIMLIADDSRRASDALKAATYEAVQEREVVVLDLENKPGALKSVSSALAAENIDINYVYGTTCGAGCPAKIVMSTNDNQKVLLTLKG
jgi:hypothetical protein